MLRKVATVTILISALAAGSYLTVEAALPAAPPVLQADGGGPIPPPPPTPFPGSAWA